MTCTNCNRLPCMCQNDKAVEKIARLRHKEREGSITWVPWADLTHRKQNYYLDRAEILLQAILSDPDIPIIEYEPDAELPKNPYDLAENVGMVDGRVANFHQQRSQGYKRCRQDMLKAGWVKEKNRARVLVVGKYAY